MNDITTNYLAAAGLIGSKIETDVPELKIFYASGMTDVDDNAQFTPAAHIWYDSSQPARKTNDGRYISKEQAWVVTLVVNHAGTQKSGYDEAGELITRLLNSLEHFQPFPRGGGLELTRCYRSENPERNIKYYHFNFSLELPRQ